MLHLSGGGLTLQLGYCPLLAKALLVFQLTKMFYGSGFGLGSSVATNGNTCNRKWKVDLLILTAVRGPRLQHGAVCVMMANKSTEIARNLRRHRRLLSGIQRLRFLHRCQCQQISGEREIIRLPAQSAEADSQPRQPDGSSSNRYAAQSINQSMQLVNKQMQ